MSALAEGRSVPVLFLRKPAIKATKRKLGGLITDSIRDSSAFLQRILLQIRHHFFQRLDIVLRMRRPFEIADLLPVRCHIFR